MTKQRRAYIDCPIMAAIAAKYHGILLVTEDNKIISDWEDLLEAHYDNCFRGKYYIHPESYDKLKPQEEDLGVDYRGRPVQFLDGAWSWFDDIGREEPFEIVRRGEHPFPIIKWEDAE